MCLSVKGGQPCLLQPVQAQATVLASTWLRCRGAEPTAPVRETPQGGFLQSQCQRYNNLSVFYLSLNRAQRICLSSSAAVQKLRAHLLINRICQRLADSKSLCAAAFTLSCILKLFCCSACVSSVSAASTKGVCSPVWSQPAAIWSQPVVWSQLAAV